MPINDRIDCDFVKQEKASQRINSSLQSEVPDTVSDGSRSMSMNACTLTLTVTDLVSKMSVIA